MDSRGKGAEVIDLFGRRPVRAEPPAAARSVVLVFPAGDDTRIIVTGPLGGATAAALHSHLDAALAGGGQVTVDLTRARIDDPVALASALRRQSTHGLWLVGRSPDSPPTAA
ncbi:MAG TPA: hypothetical protein VEG38_04555 [Acidimicrobiia bacterium]|nr:hypothetical protein [Acidimicrobiia bacterium]